MESKFLSFEEGIDFIEIVEENSLVILLGSATATSVFLVFRYLEKKKKEEEERV